MKNRTLIAAGLAVSILAGGSSAYAQNSEQGGAAAHEALAAGADREAHEDMVRLLIQGILEDTDFAAVKAHMVASAAAHAGEAGLEPEALSAHVGMFMDHLAEMQRTDPDALAGALADAMIGMHMPHN